MLVTMLDYGTLLRENPGARFSRGQTMSSGLDPDPHRPLRKEPVRRNEVRFELGFERRWLGGLQPHYELWTMPLGTFSREVRQQVGWHAVNWFVGDPSLWRSLWDEVAADLVADYAGPLRFIYREHPVSACAVEGWLPRLPELREADVRQYICQHCGRDYVGVQLLGNQRICVCSNYCERKQRNVQQRQWREKNPPDYRLINAARAIRRAETRSGRVCEYCKVPIEAKRSTRRFCSDICRVRAHRATQPSVTVTE
jgi:hypothetical protein